MQDELNLSSSAWPSSIERQAPPPVLVADDDPVSLRLVEVALAKAGYNVISVTDGQQAWEWLQRPDGPRLAVIDWMMPGMSGLEICRRLRQRKDPRYVYVILLTARSDKEDLIQGLQAGADDFIRKPFNLPELEARLRSGLRIVELQDRLLAAQRALEIRATHDYLTGLYNRQQILEVLQRELARSQREQKPLGVCVADIDHFKQINDTYGHHVGDAVLKEVAQRMRQSVRKYDAVGRYGGEEFLLVLTNCGRDNAIRSAERVRRRISDEEILCYGLKLKTTISIGVTATQAASPKDLDVLIRTADEALYEAKRKGRNCVVLKDPVLSPNVIPVSADLHSLAGPPFEPSHQPDTEARRSETE